MTEMPERVVSTMQADEEKMWRGDLAGRATVPSFVVRAIFELLDAERAALRAAEARIATLTAEREALKPLARAGLAAFDHAMAKEQYGAAILPRLDRVSIAESLTAARALLSPEAP